MNPNDATLREKANEFLLYKQSIGYQYKNIAHYLMRYVLYAEGISKDVRVPEKSSVKSFLDDLSTMPGALHNATAVLREFSRYLYSVGMNNAYIIPAKRMPTLRAEPPYFFRQQEIEAFFQACDRVKPNNTFPGRELVIPALFRILYCCGLRCKEVRIIACENVHLEENYLDILQSKGSKSRRIFISQELVTYLKEYNDAIGSIFPNRIYFFPHTSLTSYKDGIVCSNFKRLWNVAFPGFPKDTRIRAYDFRHHFALTNLNRWAKEGLDVNAMLPYLMRYMGHQTLKSTLYYFHFVPEFFPTYREISASTEDILPEVSYEE